MRLILAATSLLVTVIQLTLVQLHDPLLYSAFVLYTVYSGIIYLLAGRGSPLSPRRLAHWIDLLWYTLMILVSGAMGHAFFPLYFFAILTASFRWGYKAGLQTTLASGLCFTIFELSIVDRVSLTEFILLVVRPSALLALGYMTAWWGGMEIALKRRLALLQDVGTMSNPRFGVEHTIITIMKRLCVFHEADQCLLVLHSAYRVDPEEGETRRRGWKVASERPVAAKWRRMLGLAPPPPSTSSLMVSDLPDEVSENLTGLPSDAAIVHSAGATGFTLGIEDGPVHEVYQLVHNPLDGTATTDGMNASQGSATALERPDVIARNDELAAALDAGSFVTVPVLHYREVVGRLCLASRRLRTFTAADAEFLVQAIRQVMPTIEKVRLVDRLASGAAEEERHRIANDIHDSVIQPYLALEMGLSTVHQKIAAGDSNIAADLERLVAMIRTGVADLRGIMRDLHGSAASGDSLLPAVKRFVHRFTAATDIQVVIDAPAELPVNDRLAAEVFQMVAEGLSNIRRHTQSNRATIGLECRDSHLILWIENEGAPNRSLRSGIASNGRYKNLGLFEESYSAYALDDEDEETFIGATGEVLAAYGNGVVQGANSQLLMDPGAKSKNGVKVGGTENLADDGNMAVFTPRSISERAAALGGRAQVQQSDDGGAVVVVDIPL